MKIVFLFFIILLTNCSLSNKNSNIEYSNFSDDLTFDEYKEKLEDYINRSKYPNLNE